MSRKVEMCLYCRSIDRRIPSTAVSPRRGFPLCAWHYSQVRQGKISEEQLQEIARRLSAPGVLEETHVHEATKELREEDCPPATSSRDDKAYAQAPATEIAERAQVHETTARTETVSATAKAVPEVQASEPKCKGTPGHPCGAILGSGNKTGLCGKCYGRAWRQKKLTKSDATNTGKRKPHKVCVAAQHDVAATETPDANTVRTTVDIPGVPVAYLDQWFLNLDPNIKGALFVDWLQQKEEARV